MPIYEDNNPYKCWICLDIIKDYMMLPYEDEYFGETHSIFKNTFIIKNIENPLNSDLVSYSFLYFTCCNNCINNYLKYYGRFYKKIKTREINGKM
jgi:hypothetical protein